MWNPARRNDRAVTTMPAPPYIIDDRPPHDRDVELALVECAWRQPDLTATLGVQPEDFYGTDTEALWHAITRLHADQLEPDQVLAPQLALQHVQKPLRDAVRSLIIDFTAGHYTPDSAPIYADQIRDLANKRALLAANARLRQVLTAEATAEALDDALARLAEVAQNRTARTPSVRDRKVADRVERLRIDRDARQLIAAERFEGADGLDAGTLTELLARTADDPTWRVQNLIKSGTSTLVVAQRKTGKTTFVLDLARCLITGDPFLGECQVRPIPASALVAVLNFEMTPQQITDWADGAGIPGDRLWIANLRGRRNPFATPAARQELAAAIRAQNAAVLIIDVFGAAFTGASQNDPGEVRAWLDDLDRFARAEAGCEEVVLTTHAGWGGERSRGASSQEDWADSIITLAMDETTNRRFLRATGRSVNVTECEVVLNDNPRKLYLSGVGGRKAAAAGDRVADLADRLTQIIRDIPDGLSGYAARQLLRDKQVVFRNLDLEAALRLAAERKDLVIEAGPRNAKIYRTNPDLFPPVPTCSRNRSSDLPPPPFREGEGQNKNRSTNNHREQVEEHLNTDDELPGLPLCSECHQPTDPGRRLCHECFEAELVEHHRLGLQGLSRPQPTDDEPVSAPVPIRAVKLPAPERKVV